MGDSFVIRGRRVPLIAFEPNWNEEVDQAFSFPDDIFASRERREQRSTMMQEGAFIADQRVSFLRDGRAESVRLWNTLSALKGHPACVPWYPEPMLCSANLAGQTTFAISNRALRHSKMRTSHVCLINLQDWDAYEGRRVLSINDSANTITVDSAWQASLNPALQALYFVTAATLDGLERTDLTDSVFVIHALWKGFLDGHLP